MKRPPVLTAFLTGFILVVSGCGAGYVDSPSEAPTTTAPSASNLGGDGLPVQHPGEGYGHHPTRLTGVANLPPDGCWTVDLGDEPRLVVFPLGFVKPTDDARVMEGPDGTRINNGMAIDAIGGITLAAAFPGLPDGFWGNYLAFCDSPTHELVVLDSVGAAFDPHTLSDDQLVEVLRGADLTVSWGCGLGFTISTADQQVALSAHPVDASGENNSSVSFPSPAWEATVTIGKNLLVDNCDDVVEGWEPAREVVARWPLTAGNLEFTPPEEGCAAGEPVEAHLTGALVETPLGPIELSDVTIVNDAYGCFAG